MSEVAYVQVVRVRNKYVWEARDSDHNVISKSKQYASEAEAQQAGADANPHIYDEETGEVLVSAPPVRHAVVNDGEK